jgi:hypothetical protein
MATVTARHQSSPDVTATNPPALLCPALPCSERPTYSGLNAEGRRSVDAEVLKEGET